ncbi:MAG: hypothetical protein WD055_04965 [Candidatus Dependentiae bacterium]
MRFLVLAFCMFNLMSYPQSPTDLLTDQEKAYCAQTAKEIANKCNYSFEQNSLILNLFYHMYYFAQLDAVFRKNVNLCISQLTNAQDILDPEQNFVEKRMDKLFGQILVLARRRLQHYQTWQLIDAQIEQENFDIYKTIETLKNASDNLINTYAQRCTHDIDQMIQQEQTALKQSASNAHVIAHTFDILINQPELMCNQSSDTIDLQKINILYGLSNIVSKEMKQLYNSKEHCIHYAFTLQMVAAELFKQSYHELHDKITYTFPDSTVKAVIALNGTLVKIDDALQTNSENQ